MNELFDFLYMMGRDDIPFGVGGDGGISDAGEIHPDVGGYLRGCRGRRVGDGFGGGPGVWRGRSRGGGT